MKVKNTYDIVDDKIGRIYVGRRGFYGLVSKPTNVYRKCPLCGGNKRININGETYTCPKCNGRSTGDMWYSYTQYSLVECYIESIVISSTSYQSSISPVSVDDTQNGCNRNDFSVVFSPVDPDKRCSAIGNKLSSRELSKYIFTPNDVDFDNVSKFSGYLYRIKFTDKSTASKLQRMLNKSEKERVAEYAEEAKRLKETTSEFSYEL